MGVSKVDYGNETLIDLTADTVSEYSLYKGATAHGANGELVTGGLISQSAVISADDEGCSAHELVFNCPFEPKFISLHFLSGLSSATTYTVLDLMVWLKGGFDGVNPANSSYYCGHSTTTYSNGRFGISRHQFEIGEGQQRFTWDSVNKKVHLRTPDDTTYKFSTSNYRLVCAK